MTSQFNPLFVSLILLVASCGKTDSDNNKEEASIQDTAQAREYLCTELNKQLPIRLDSSSILYKATIKSGSLVYFVKINTEEFVRIGNSIGQPIPSTNTIKQVIYKQTWNQLQKDPSYGPFKKVFDSAKYVYVNERNQKLFDFTIEF